MVTRFIGLLALVLPALPAAADPCDSLAPQRADARVSLEVAEPEIRNDLPLTVIERRAGRSRTILAGKIEIGKRVQYESEIRTRAAPGGKGLCFWLREIDIRITLEPVTIFIAEQSSPSSCRYEATLRHERQHLEYEKTALDEALVGLRGTVRGARRPRFAESEEDARKRARAMVSGWLETTLADADREARRGHERLDSPENARREQRQCNGWN